MAAPLRWSGSSSPRRPPGGAANARAMSGPGGLGASRRVSADVVRRIAGPPGSLEGVLGPGRLNGSTGLLSSWPSCGPRLRLHLGLVRGHGGCLDGVLDSGREPVDERGGAFDRREVCAFG